MEITNSLKKNELRKLYHLLSQSNNFMPNGRQYSELYEKFEKDKMNEAAFCFFNDELVGCACIFGYQRLQGGLFGIIEDVVVASDFQNQGVGTKLVGYLLRFACEHNFKRVALVSSPAGEKIYKKFGFRIRENYFEKRIDGFAK